MNILKIENFATVKGGKRLPKGHELVNYKTSHPYIRARDIKNGKINFEEPKYLDEVTFLRIKNYIVKKDEIIITIVGVNIGDVAYVTSKFQNSNLTENAVKISTDETKVIPKYLFYYLFQKDLKQYFQLIASGAAQGKLGLYKIKKTPINIPSYFTQKKIVEILSNYDNLIENNLHRIALLEESIKITYEEWFLRFRIDGKKLDIDCSTSLPHNWKTVSLTDYIDLKRGVEPGSEKYEDVKTHFNVAFIRVGDLDKRDSDTFIPQSLAKNKFINPADIVISLDGSPGKVQYGLSGCYSSGIRKAVSKRKNISNIFIFNLLNAQNIQGLIEAYASGATILHAGSSVKKMQFILPPDDILKKYNETEMYKFEIILNLLNINRLLEETRDILLPRLVSGIINIEKLDITT